MRSHVLSARLRRWAARFDAEPCITIQPRFLDGVPVIGLVGPVNEAQLAQLRAVLEAWPDRVRATADAQGRTTT